MESEDFADYLKLTANGNTYYFQNDLTVEFDDCENLNADIELIRAEDYFKIKSKNPFLKLLVFILKLIISPIIFFTDNDDGIRLYRGYKTFNPYTIKKSFSISNPNEKTVNLIFTNATYNDITKKFTPSDIIIECDGIQIKSEEIRFSKTILKHEWNEYHITGFALLMLLVSLLNTLDFVIFAKVIGDIASSTVSENVFGVLGMLFCSFVLVGLFVACVVIIVKSCRLKKEVININSKSEV